MPIHRQQPSGSHRTSGPGPPVRIACPTLQMLRRRQPYAPVWSRQIKEVPHVLHLRQLLWRVLLEWFNEQAGTTK